MQQVQDRLHYMDNLRALIMIAGVFFHAALAYSPFMHPIWLTADPVKAPAMDWLVNFLHTFRMPLFFIIAGFFTALLIERRGAGGMLRNRTLRILVPFLIFWPIVYFSVRLPAGWALLNVENLSPLLQFIQSQAEKADVPPSRPSTLHLWFLYYLAFFYLFSCVFRRLPLKKFKAAILNLPPSVIVLVFPLALAPWLWTTTMPFPAPNQFSPQIWAFGFFGLFFAYGYALFSSHRQLVFFDRIWSQLVLASAMLSAVFLWALPEQATADQPSTLIQLTLVLCTAYMAVFMSVACLVGARKLLNQRNGLMRYMSDASYWIYIAHFPIVLGIQYWIMDQPGGAWYKFGASSLGALLICLISYALLVRNTPIGWLLNGQRKKSNRIENTEHRLLSK